MAQGVGSTLDTIVGTVRRAPEIWCKLQFEWLYKLIMESRRIKRQKVLPLLAAMVLIVKIKMMIRGRKRNLEIPSN